jgi:MoaA/NifB/PqqE/SkfB family radical SAM enzyme
MHKGMFFDGNLYRINEQVVKITDFCQDLPLVKCVLEKFSGTKELEQLLSTGVIVADDGRYKIAKSVKFLDSLENVLTAITFYFGFQCNLNCGHCHSRIAARDAMENMSHEQAKFITEEIIKARPLSVRLGGGEPLMRDDFLPTVTRLTEAGITTSFTTNGWYMDKEIATSLKRLSNLEPVRLSIHGFGDEHDGFTKVNGSFERLLVAQQILKEFGLEHKFVVVISSQTKDRVGAFIDFAENAGAGGILFRALKLSGNATLDQFISPEEWRSIYRLISDESEKRNIKVDFSPSGPPVTGYLGLNEKCLCGRNTLTIRPSGDFSACGIAFDKVGNVFEDELSQCWEKHPKFDQIRGGFCPCETKNGI